MASETKKRFTVISNSQPMRGDYSTSVTNPISYEAQDLREKLMKFRNNDDNKKFSIEDLLKW